MSVIAQNNGNSTDQYRRSSIYSLIVNHTDQSYADHIRNQFLAIPVSDKYNDHNLSVRVVGVAFKPSKKEMDNNVQRFVSENHIASRLVGRWFDRDKQTGECNMNVVKARGLYDATEFDKEMASHSTRGLAMLQDAGEDLIGNTYLIVNEVRYVDKGATSKIVGTTLNVLTMTAGAVGAIALIAAGGDASTASDLMDLGKNTGQSLDDLASSLKGFRVKITTRLFQLNWNDTISNFFYSQCYSEKPDAVKKENFEKNRDKFTMRYLGKVVSKGNKTSFLGISEDEPLQMIRKATERAIDENVVDLQRKFPQFRVKSPISDVVEAGGVVVKAPIGKKEGVDPMHKYEVLEVRESNGRIEYHKVGTVQPISGLVWDNRFMAHEEGAEGADLEATTFKVLSGSGFYPGMLLREL
ncbi:MAG: hypothetical protein IJ764_02410 [Bacteroidales bacterium]|nr:hypothetical protein [Bacteroidales bacterium]